MIGLAACGSPTTPGTAAPAPRRTRCTAALRFEDADEGAAPSDVAMPRTRVTLVRICDPGGTETRVVGTEPGICQFGDPGVALLRARCWWTGQGSELELHRVLRQLVVRRATLTESGELGPFEDVLDLDLPAGAELDVLGPETLPRRP